MTGVHVYRGVAWTINRTAFASATPAKSWTSTVLHARRGTKRAAREVELEAIVPQGTLQAWATDQIDRWLEEGLL